MAPSSLPRCVEAFQLATRRCLVGLAWTFLRRAPASPTRVLLTTPQQRRAASSAAMKEHWKEWLGSNKLTRSLLFVGSARLVHGSCFCRDSFGRLVGICKLTYPNLFDIGLRKQGAGCSCQATHSNPDIMR